MNFSGLFPIGTVVLLKNSTKRLMVTGVCQFSVGEDGANKFYDYVGVVFPEGYLSAEENFLFNNDQIDKVYCIGYQDAESLAFKDQADAAAEEIRARDAGAPAEG